MAPKVYKIEAVGRVEGTGEAYVRYTGVPGRHVVNASAMPERIQVAFRSLMERVQGKVEDMANNGYDLYEACQIVANERNEMMIRN